jgi:peptide/nickel transport system permease protein
LGAACLLVVLPWVARNRLALGAGACLLCLYLLAALGPAIAPYPPNAVDIRAVHQRPNAAHRLGTDESGRDVLSRVIVGARASLTVGLIAMLVAISIGVVVGGLAGYFGRLLDAVLMRVTDGLLAIPTFFLALIVVAVFRPTFLNLILVIGGTSWMTAARVVRSEVLRFRARDFVLAARALGAGDARILWRHVLPNVLSPVIVAATLGIGHVIVLEAGLSYLGFGVQQPTPSWGNIIRDAEGAVGSLWWISLFPGLAIVATVMAFNVVGDGLRDALDPRAGFGIRDWGFETAPRPELSSPQAANPESRNPNPNTRLRDHRSPGQLSAP